jgi:molybdopterin-guanine dinucleotide biosynthesis protein A
VEQEPGQGPLAAIAAGWRALVDRRYAGPCLALACDLPRMSVPLLRLLAEWPGEGTVVPVSEGVPQTLCARYSKEALARAESLVAGGARSARALLAEETRTAEVTLVPPATWGTVAPPEVFADLDTPDDLVRLGLTSPSEDRI